MSSSEIKPRARKSDLVVQEMIDGEVVVYDGDRHDAHCLNPSVALVWRFCDGMTPVDRISRLVTMELDQAFSSDLVKLALVELAEAGLMEESSGTGAPETTVHPPNRREVISRMGKGALIAALIPAISTILVPSPAAAASCLASGAACTSGLQCCSGQCVGFVCA